MKISKEENFLINSLLLDVVSVRNQNLTRNRKMQFCFTSVTNRLAEYLLIVLERRSLSESIN